MTRNRRWYVQLAFGFLAMLASMGLVDRYITPAVAAPAPIKVETLPGRIAPKLPEFWIGLRCYAPIPDALRAHIDIPEGQGLIVVDVVDQSPGQKSGVRKNDILINVGKKPLRNVNDLVGAVEDLGEKSGEIGLLRGGKPVSVTVTPEKRPKEMQRPTIPTIPNTPGMEQIRRWFEQAQPGQSFKKPMRLQFYHPGMVLPPDALTHPGLPEGMSISIFRVGKEPAQIAVKRYNAKEKKEEAWKLTEKELYKLPVDVRPYVERMLNGVIVGTMPQFDFMPSLGPSQSSSSPRPKARDALRQQIQQMQEQMDRMNQMMNQMEQQMLKPEPAAMP